MERIRILSLTTLLAALLLSLNLQADDYSKVRAAMHALAPHLEITSIQAIPVPGMVEVVLGGQVVYMSDDGRFLIEGALFDIEARRDLTEERRADLRHSALAGVTEEQMIRFDAEDPRHTITVFTDIDCGYCRKLHNDIDKYNERGISVHYLLFPRAGRGSHSYEKAVSVYCADDSRIALTEAKLGAEPEPRQCDNPVDEHMKLGRLSGVTGTPAIVTADGTMVAGYLPPDALAARLDLLESLGEK